MSAKLLHEIIKPQDIPRLKLTSAIRGVYAAGLFHTKLSSHAAATAGGGLAGNAVPCRPWARVLAGVEVAVGAEVRSTLGVRAGVRVGCDIWVRSWLVALAGIEDCWVGV